MRLTWLTRSGSAPGARGKGGARPPPRAKAPPPSRKPAVRLSGKPGAPASQGLAVELVRLGPPPPARRGDRSRIDHMALDPFPLQDAVKPEPVQPRFLNDGDRKASRSAPPPCASTPQSAPAVRRRLPPPRSHGEFRHLLAIARRKRRDQPRLSAQFQRNENRAKLPGDGGRFFQVIAQHRSSPG